VGGFRSWRSYWDFERTVRRDRRYVRSAKSETFLESVSKGAALRKITLKKGSNFWRAQLGHDWRTEKQGDEEFEVPCAHPPDRMTPLRDRASEGRANPKGIPCLYLATTKETAMSEVRPWIGSEISVGQFKLLEALDVIDCSSEHDHMLFYFEEPAPEEIERSVWAHIDRAFAEPMTRSDNTADYVATQIIAELFKDAGYDGVAYKSNFGEKGYNIALFDIDAADLINCGLFRVDSIDMKFSEQDNPYFVSKYYPSKTKK
jgi:RES domain-containing protein